MRFQQCQTLCLMVETGTSSVIPAQNQVCKIIHFLPSLLLVICLVLYNMLTMGVCSPGQCWFPLRYILDNIR